MKLRTVIIAAASLASVLSLTTSQAEARARVYITGYAANPYYTGTGLSWYAVRAYYYGGPWSGPGWGYANGWADYAAQNGIGCTPGTTVKGGDGILYMCQ
jgi:hypothetical protein